MISDVVEGVYEDGLERGRLSGIQTTLDRLQEDVIKFYDDSIQKESKASLNATKHYWHGKGKAYNRILRLIKQLRKEYDLDQKKGIKS